ncbi:class III poly(R)-hydroxyalkanoic acid synthase subunit PhaC [Desulfonema magnum]|uniref:Poly(3-hydroxyalkanoate) polymerase subunit PhaC n=1 Tax=Desulfonema magnum TaxID=45655 RepID=A0A975BP14_9BACT|nr:class III poly(R)-hydroxyalkanoic acid synthase subunit PhaC [Desulfonema magnum]QTA88728.1 Poly(3-hydroxyalkanoate) polymerase, subunit PhaC [Desulfonema magnum]
MSQPKIAVDLILKKLAETTEQVKTRAQKASEVLLGPLETDLSTTPYEVVYEEDRIKLKYYRPTEIKQKYPLLVVYALINRETMLDLQPGRSVVQTFLDNGIEVYMIDWGYPTRKDQYLTIDDHVDGYMDNVVDFIRDKHNLPKINLMGICMGGAFSVMYSALYPEKIKNLVTTVTPTNFDTDKGLLHIWMKQTDAYLMGNSYGNMPGDLMNLGFLLLNPARLILDKYVGFFENMDNKAFVENFVRMEKWIFDSPDVPAATFQQFITDCYKKNLLIQSKMELSGRRVELKNITMPILNFYGEYDHLVPPQACELLTQKVGAEDTEDICLKTGHIGIYVSSSCQKEFAPKIVKWLREREGEVRPGTKEQATFPNSVKDKIGKKTSDASKNKGRKNIELVLSNKRSRKKAKSVSPKK